MSETAVTRREARALDRALAGENGHGDPDGFVALASELREAFDFELPNPNRERAMFVSGVGTRHQRFNPLRVLAPAVAFLALLALAYLGGRTALPGDSLYPVREALDSVGLAQSPIEEIDSRVVEADELLTEAERFLDDRPGTSLRLAVQALEELGPAIELLEELEGDELETRTDAIDALEARAVDIIGAAAPIGRDAGSGEDPRGNGGSSGSDSSGSGSSGDSDGDDDRSGSNSGSGDGDDDNSGPGDASGSDDGDDSGPGDGDDDRSGSNSGSGDGDDDDNSGPGGGGDDVDEPEIPDIDENRDGGDGDDSSGPGGGGDDEDDKEDDDKLGGLGDDDDLLS